MSEVDMDSEDFLEIVWGKRRGWVDLPAKVSGNWVPYYTEWDGNGCGTSITRRIDSCLRDHEDLYFSVAQFGGMGRNETEFKASSWLWADLDEVHPTKASKMGLTPTIAWASSEGRYQALWKLDRVVGANTHNRLNQALSYALGADRGGWDLTQVLRLPGTRNWKYKNTPLISLLWYHKDLVYDPRQIWAKVKRFASRDALRLGGQLGLSLPRKPLPAQAKALLRVQSDTTVEGWRSNQLWKLECLLVESGWGEDEIYEIIKDTPWHKWAHRRDSEAKLREDIKRAISHVYRTKRQESEAEEGRVHADAGTGDQVDSGSVGAEEDDGLEVSLPPSPRVRYAKFMATPLTPPRWLIEGIWTDKAHGIIGGEAKTLKTTLAVAMGMSVASGKPFLGTFEAPSPGPVLYIQEENDPSSIQDTMHKVAASYGLISEEDATTLPSPEGSIGSTIVSLRFPDDIPFHLWNNFGTDLKDDVHLEMIERDIQEIRPAMLILDPFENMIGDTDLDRSHEIRPHLIKLMRWRFEYDMAVVVLHHMRKSLAHRSGQRMLGSAMFHGWTASALYLTDKTPKDHHGWKHVMVDREFREQGPQDELKVSLKMGLPGSLAFEAVVLGWNQADQLVDLVLQAGGKIPVVEAMETLEIKKDALRRRVVGSGLLDYAGGKGRGDTRYIVYRGENNDSSS